MQSNDDIDEDILRKQALIREHKRVLHILEQQAAGFGLYIPPNKQIEIEDTREKIYILESEIKELELGKSRQDFSKAKTKEEDNDVDDKKREKEDDLLFQTLVKTIDTPTTPVPVEQTTLESPLKKRENKSISIFEKLLEFIFGHSMALSGRGCLTIWLITIIVFYFGLPFLIRSIPREFEVIVTRKYSQIEVTPIPAPVVGPIDYNKESVNYAEVRYINDGIGRIVITSEDQTSLEVGGRYLFVVRGGFFITEIRLVSYKRIPP